MRFRLVEFQDEDEPLMGPQRVPGDISGKDRQATRGQGRIQGGPWPSPPSLFGRQPETTDRGMKVDKILPK